MLYYGLIDRLLNAMYKVEQRCLNHHTDSLDVSHRNNNDNNNTSDSKINDEHAAKDKTHAQLGEIELFIYEYLHMLRKYFISLEDYATKEYEAKKSNNYSLHNRNTNSHEQNKEHVQQQQQEEELKELKEEQELIEEEECLENESSEIDNSDEQAAHREVGEALHLLNSRFMPRLTHDKKLLSLFPKLASRMKVEWQHAKTATCTKLSTTNIKADTNNLSDELAHNALLLHQEEEEREEEKEEELKRKNNKINDSEQTHENTNNNNINNTSSDNNINIISSNNKIDININDNDNLDDCFTYAQTEFADRASEYSNEIKLKFYGLYKQAIEGDVNIKAP